mmetsp:Transcript_34313/g.78192  ORF Transcript_34313/g.78192 Transcript_34313/m.78192 type:complete len:226 (-) Transcript_34313:35-712(-)
MQSGVALGVDSERVGTVVQQKLHDSDTVSTDGIAQGCDALAILCIKRLLLLQVLLHRLDISVLCCLMKRQWGLLQLLKLWFQLLWQTAHLLADLQHQLFICSVLHHSLKSVSLDVLKNSLQLWIALQVLHLALHSLIVCIELCAVVFCDGLCLQPAPHRLWVSGELLQVLRLVRVTLQVSLHLSPCGIVDIWNACEAHGRSIAELNGLTGCCHAGKWEAGTQARG